MSRKPFVELRQQALDSFPDNTTGFISPELLRTFVTDYLDTMQPGYGIIQQTGAAVALSATTTPQTLTVFNTSPIVTSEFVTDLGAGTVQAAIPMINQASFSLEYEAGNNIECMFQVRSAADPTFDLWRSVAVGRGTNRPQVAPIYSLWDVGAGGDTFSIVYYTASGTADFTVQNAFFVNRLGPLINPPT